MAPKPKARTAPDQASAEAEKQKAQSERFIAAAQEAGVDESGKEFDRVINRLVGGKPR